MTRIKLCGLSRPEDILAANALRPEYVGFVFAQKSRRRVALEQARALRASLRGDILAVGVFVREDVREVAALINGGIIDLAQLHGGEDFDYVRRLRTLTAGKLIQAFRVSGPADLRRAAQSPADYILLDNGAGGTGEAFDWSLLKGFKRPYFLAGGLDPGNAEAAVAALRPFAVDVSSGIETAGVKDRNKMKQFVEAVRAASGKENGR